MIYILDDDASKDRLKVRGELHKYLFKVRRHSLGDEIAFRSRVDLAILYRYKVAELDARDAHLELVGFEKNEVKQAKRLTVGWCVVDSSSIEKVLPMLCEIGVEKVVFVGCERSQKNFKIDFARFERIVEASMQQSGRSSMMEFAMAKSVADFMALYPEAKVFDFSDKTLGEYAGIESVLVGCEGGFSPKEREFLEPFGAFSLATSMVLRSESAVVAVASKILL